MSIIVSSGTVTLTSNTTSTYPVGNKGTLIFGSGGTTSATTVNSGGLVIINAGGTRIGLSANPGGIVNGSGGFISSAATNSTTNDGILEASGGNAYLGILGNAANAGTIVASATGSGGFAEVFVDGGTLVNSGGKIVAAATSAGPMP